MRPWSAKIRRKEHEDYLKRAREAIEVERANLQQEVQAWEGRIRLSTVFEVWKRGFHNCSKGVKSFKPSERTPVLLSYL